MTTGQPPDPDATFADVLNGLAIGRRKRATETRPETQPGTRPETQPEPLAEPQWTAPAPHKIEYDAYPGPSADAAIVRPYAWTGGRTKSTMELRIETMVSISEHGENIEAMIQIEHRSIARLCHEPRSVAEVATLLSVPLGVAKVLLSDMAGLGLVIVHKTATGGANKAHLMLMERVLSGLRRL